MRIVYRGIYAKIHIYIYEDSVEKKNQNSYTFIIPKIVTVTLMSNEKCCERFFLIIVPISKNSLVTNYI